MTPILAVVRMIDPKALHAAFGTVPAEHHAFPGLKAFGRIASCRQDDGTRTSESRSFALSSTLAPEVRWTKSVPIGRTVTPCTDNSSCRPAKMQPTTARIIPLATSPSCDVALSISSDGTPTRAPSPSSSSAQAGTTHSYAAFSEVWQRRDPTAIALGSAHGPAVSSWVGFLVVQTGASMPKESHSAASSRIMS